MTSYMAVFTKKRFSLTDLVLLLIIMIMAGWIVYHAQGHAMQPQSARNRPVRIIHVHASAALVNEVSRADVHYLHKVGNWKAHLADRQAEKVGLSPKYKKSDDGNYWSYLEDHRPIGNDVFDAADAAYAGSGSDDYATSTDNSSAASGIVANEKVLRHHGVKSGINFVHYNNEANSNGIDDN